MINIAALALAVIPNTYEVVSAEHHIAFAGRLGQRITQTVTLRHDGATLKVSIGRQHTRCGSVHLFIAGERVELRGLPESGSVSANPDQVVLVKT